MNNNSSIQERLQWVAKINFHGILLARQTGSKDLEIMECFLLAMSLIGSMTTIEKPSLQPQQKRKGNSSFEGKKDNLSPLGGQFSDCTDKAHSFSGSLIQSIPLDCERQDEEESSFYLFSRALHIDIASSTSFNPDVAAVALCGAIVYNMALISYLQNSNSLKQQKYCLELFRLAKGTFSSYPTLTKHMNLGSLASINNMGTLYSRLWRKTEAEMCADTLRKRKLPIEDHDDECFYLTILCYQAAKFRAAGMA